jgi:hypothetical protein
MTEALAPEALSARMRLRGFTSHSLTFVILNKQTTIRIGFSKEGVLARNYYVKAETWSLCFKCLYAS